MNLKKLMKIIRKNKTFLVATHINPDPDALCSELALAGFLNSLGKKVSIINEEKVPQRFVFLPGSRQIRVWESVKNGPRFDAAVILDCGDLGRIGKVRNLLSSETTLVNIDHHLTNDYFGDFNLVDSNASSTTEVIYELLKKNHYKLNQKEAMLLYVGIMTDTGSFRYENTTARTHQIVSDLMRFKLSPFDLYRRIYESIPLNDLAIFTKVMNDFDVLFKGKVIAVDLPKRVISKFSDEFDLRDTIFKYVRSVKGVEAIVIFTEVSPRKTRVNLRSSGKINVGKLAYLFKGGGHRAASGCVLDKNMKQARRIIFTEMKKIF